MFRAGGNLYPEFNMCLIFFTMRCCLLHGALNSVGEQLRCSRDDRQVMIRFYTGVIFFNSETVDFT